MKNRDSGPSQQERFKGHYSGAWDDPLHTNHTVCGFSGVRVQELPFGKTPFEFMKERIVIDGYSESDFALLVKGCRMHKPDGGHVFFNRPQDADAWLFATRQYTFALGLGGLPSNGEKTVL